MNTKQQILYFSRRFREILLQKIGKPALLSAALAVIFLFLMIGLSLAVVTDQTEAFDLSLEKNFSAFENRWLHDYLELLTNFNLLVAVLLVAVLIFLWRRIFWAAGFLTLAGIGALALNEGLKNLFQRVRPGLALDDNLFSYPSGHTAVATALFGALIYTSYFSVNDYRIRLIWNVGLTLLIIAVGVSRVYFNFHYPTDVAGGFLIGGCYLASLISVNSFLRHKKLK